MQILELSGGMIPFPVALHPRLTVLIGLGGRRSEIAEALAHALVGVDPGGIDGRLDFGDRVAGFREWAAVVGPEVKVSDVLVRRDDLRGLGPLPTPPASPTELLAAVEVTARREAEGSLEPSPRQPADGAEARAGDVAPAVFSDLAQPALRATVAQPVDETEVAPRRDADPASRIRQLAVLVDRWDDVATRWRAAMERRIPPARVEAAYQRLQAAREGYEVADAESPDASRPMRPADMVALDAAHRARLDAEERAGRFLAGSAARRRLEAATAAEEALLAKFGVDGYVSAMVGSAMGGGGDPEQAEIVRAREALAEAEAEWASVEGVGGPSQIAAVDLDREVLVASAADLGLLASGARVADEGFDELWRSVGAVLVSAALGASSSVDDPNVVVPPGGARPEEGLFVEMDLLAAVTRARGLLPGGVPLVLDDPLTDLAVTVVLRTLELLNRVSGAHQLVYFADDPVTVAWAIGLGPEAATLCLFDR